MKKTNSIDRDDKTMRRDDETFIQQRVPSNSMSSMSIARSMNDRQATHLFRRLCLCLLLTSGVLASSDMEAQETEAPAPRSILGGPTLGYLFGMQSGAIPIYSGSPGCGEFTSGSASMPWGGGTLVLPSLFSSDLGLSTRVVVQASSGRFSATPLDRQRVFDPTTMSLVELDRELRLNSSIMTVAIDLMGRYRLGERLSVGLGPSLGFRVSSTIEQTDNILGPAGHGFTNGQSEAPLADATVLESSPFSFGAVASGAYELPLGGATLQPELTLRADLMSPVKEYSWSSISLGVGASVLFDLTPSPAPPPPPPPAIETPRIPALNASIEVAGVDSMHRKLPVAAIRVREVIGRQHTPLLPVLFFDSASAMIPDRYVYLSAEQSQRFGSEWLAAGSPIERYHHLLNVIGSRMRSNPTATITISGMTSAREPAQLASARAASVRSYLHETWGIDESRLKSRTGAMAMARSSDASDDGRAENQRVEIAASSPSLLDAIVSERVEREFDPPTVVLNPIVEAEAGVKKWSIAISQNGRTIERFDGEGEAASREWKIDRSRLDTSASELVAELTIEDATGRTATARGSVPLALIKSRRVVDSRREERNDRERFDYVLAAFDYNSSELTGRNAAAVKEIAEQVDDGATITITGYTDRSGAEELNAALSQQRAERTARQLRSLLEAKGIDNVKIDVVAGGVDTSRFENEYPEGRMLSRGARIVVEQGVRESEEP